MTMCLIIYVLGVIVASVLTVFPLGKILVDLMRGKCSMVKYCTDNKILLVGGVVGFAVASVFVLQGYAERRNEYLHYVNNGVETVGEIDKVRKVLKPHSGGRDPYAYAHKVIYSDKDEEYAITFERAYSYAVGDKVRVLYLKDDIHQAMVFDFSNGVLYHALMLMMGLAFASLAASLFMLSCIKMSTNREKSP